MIAQTTKLRTLFLILLIILPFWVHNSSDNIEPQRITNEFVGYYQSNTCEISLIEVYLTNLGNENNIFYSNNYYAGAECFGKVTGLDKVNDKFIVSIGTNTSLLFLIQSILWLTLLSFIKPKNRTRHNFYLLYLFLPLLFTYQHISESRFYERLNIYHMGPNEGLVNNFYLLGIFFTYLFLFLVVGDLLSKRESDIVNYLPYGFLFVFTFGGFNINFYLMIFSYFGLKNLIKRNSDFKLNIVYLLFSAIWLLLSNRDTNSFFDTDKLRGNINSSNNTESLFFWIAVFYLCLYGAIFIYKNSKINITILRTNLIKCGSITFLCGIVGSVSPLFNFYINHLFGQNKRGITDLSSIAGNTWRGFSSSAESIGEFYAFIILFTIITTFLFKIPFSKLEIYMLLLILFGLYRSNNFAAFSSLLLIGIVYLIENFIHGRKTKNIIYASFTLMTVVAIYYIINILNYEYLSTQLLYEASLHSNFFSYADNYGKSLRIETLFNEERIYYLINIEGADSVSTSLRRLSSMFYQKFNIPLIPNFVAMLSMTSVLINRSEMWGIFFAKFSPNTIEAIFGYGPNQFNGYLYNQKVRLDLPPEKLTGLFLPHSSFFDILIFFGILGFVIFLAAIFKTLLYKSNDGAFKFLFVFLIINFLKSDSLLYISSTMLLLLSVSLVFSKEYIHVK